MKKILPFNFLVIFLVIALSLPVVLPFFHNGYFPTHDGEWAVIRMAEMFREIRDYQFPPRYSDYLNFGYGYPLFNFAYPFPYYLGTGLHFLGIGFVDSVKIIFVLTVPLSALFMFLASREFWGSRAAGFVSALLYIYLPYRMVDLYVRGSIGESLAFVFFAAIFYILVKLINNHRSKSLIVIGAIFYAMLITTHNIMVILFTLVIGLFLICFIAIERKKDIIFPLLVLFVFGLALSAFFWMPAIFEKKNILLSVVPIADRSLYYVDVKKLILPSWGFGNPTDKNGFSYQLGLPQLTVLILSLSLLILSWLKNKRNFLKETEVKYAVILVLILFILIFLLFPQSDFVWKMPFLSEINYPWTMLAPIGFLISLLSGFLASKAGFVRYLLLILSVISIFLFLPYARPQLYFDKGDNFYLTNDATTTSSDELMPLWVRSKPTQRWENKVEMVTGAGSIQNIAFTSRKITFDVDAKNDTKIRVNTIYYPGWKAFVDDQVVSIDYKNEKGVMDIFVQNVKYDVRFVFGETSLRFFADILSIFSFLILLGYGLFKIRARLVKTL